MYGLFKLENMGALIVDGDLQFQGLLKWTLHDLGVSRIKTAVGPVEAFELMRDTLIDLVVTELDMAPMDGREFIKLLRWPDDSPNLFIPIIVLSERTTRRQVEAVRYAGMNGFLAEPVSTQRLYRRLVKIVECPRPFIKMPTFFGPDRRWHNNPRYRGAGTPPCHPKFGRAARYCSM